MANKRLIPRVRRRLRVTVNGNPAFTSDVSPGGFCVELMDVLPIGSDVTGTIEVGGTTFQYSGKVAWNVASERKIMKRGRMGVRFIGMDPRFYERYSADVAENSPPSVPEHRA